MEDCSHKSTYYIDEIPLTDTIEVCKDCGMSRSHWEQGESDWLMVGLEKVRKELEETAKDLEGSGDA